jgi:hypothetical protein
MQNHQNLMFFKIIFYYSKLCRTCLVWQVRVCDKKKPNLCNYYHNVV